MLPISACRGILPRLQHRAPAFTASSYGGVSPEPQQVGPVYIAAPAAAHAQEDYDTTVPEDSRPLATPPGGTVANKPFISRQPACGGVLLGPQHRGPTYTATAASAHSGVLPGPLSLGPSIHTCSRFRTLWHLAGTLPWGYSLQSSATTL